LCKGKTLVHRSLFSLNSAFFSSQRHRVREIPVLRPSMLLSSDGLPSGDSFTKFVRGWKLEARRLVGGLWLSLHRGKIRRSGRSVVGGLGIPADNSQLHTAGLADREAFYRGSRANLALLESRPPPPPDDFSTREKSEWSFTDRPLLCSKREGLLWDEQHIQWCSARAWVPGERAGSAVRFRRWKEWWSEVEATGFESCWHRWRRSSIRARRICPKLGISLRVIGLVPPVRRGQWVPADILPGYLCGRAGVGA
jgi:hypothetical protein